MTSGSGSTGACASIYGSPAYSQIYSELKKLERLGLVTSRVENTGGTRNRRLYKITEAGLDAATRVGK